MTSRVRRPRSCARMPLSIASCTIRSARPGAARRAMPTTASSATRQPAADEVAAEAGQPDSALTRQRSLLSEERGEHAAVREQLVRRARLDDPPVVEHDGAVGDLDGREPLGRDQHRAARERGAEVLDEVALGLRVDGRHRVVEHDHARPRDERPRERDPLALPAGEVDAALADQRVVAVGQLGREMRDTGRLAGCDDLVPRGVGPGGGQVVAQRDREENRPLRHDRDRARAGRRPRGRGRRRRRRARARSVGS